MKASDVFPKRKKDVVLVPARKERIAAFLGWLRKFDGLELWALDYMRHQSVAGTLNQALLPTEDLTDLTHSHMDAIKMDHKGFIERVRKWKELNDNGEVAPVEDIIP